MVRAISRIDPSTNTVVSQTQVSGLPMMVEVAAGHVWATTSQSDQLVRIDPVTNEVDATVDLQEHPFALSSVAEGLWVAGAAGMLDRVDSDGSIVRQLTVPGLAGGRFGTGTLGGVAEVGGVVFTSVRDLPTTSGVLDPGHRFLTIDPSVTESSPTAVTHLGSLPVTWIRGIPFTGPFYCRSAISPTNRCRNRLDVFAPSMLGARRSSSSRAEVRAGRVAGPGTIGKRGEGCLNSDSPTDR